MFTPLTPEQLALKASTIQHYMGASNAATGATLDPNANVSQKNIATMAHELNKDINIQVNRYLLKEKIREMWGDELAEEYIRQLNDHEIYCHDETTLFPYCVSISMYPFLRNGLTDIGGDSTAPKHLDTFCGGFLNLLFLISSQFAGAVATVEFLMCFDHFARKDYGEDYLDTHAETIKGHFAQVVYTANQPAAARGNQSVFWNISLFDKGYFDSLFEGFVFPDNDDRPSWTSVEKLQWFFMEWFREERTKALLTFPVVTATVLTSEVENVLGKAKVFADQKYVWKLAHEMSKGSSFFVYMSDSVDSLASCCRLRNEFAGKREFSFTLGAGGVSTGSANVMTMNMNVLYQKEMEVGRPLLAEWVSNVHCYQLSYRALMKEYEEAGLMPVYSAGYISLDKQFLTLGINGLVEAAEFLGIPVRDDEQYQHFVSTTLNEIAHLNKVAGAMYKVRFNTEMVPAEGLGVKFAKWDKENNWASPRECYNSYLYPVESAEIDEYEKFTLHGSEYTGNLDGGSALHINLDQHLSPSGFYSLFCMALVTGCNYWTFNVPSTCCEEPDCGFISPANWDACPRCGSEWVSKATRVIGYLKKVPSFSEPRQREHARRHYHTTE